MSILGRNRKKKTNFCLGASHEIISPYIKEVVNNRRVICSKFKIVNDET